MDWSAIFAGAAALTSIIGLIYSVRQHRDNIRKEFILWALQQMQSQPQRETRAYFWYLNRKENIKKKQKLIDGIRNGDMKIIYGEDYGKIRASFALFSQIGYFWSKAGYGNINDVRALFPQMLTIWDISQEYIDAIRSRPNQSTSYIYYEKLVLKLNKGK